MKNALAGQSPTLRPRMTSSGASASIFSLAGRNRMTNVDEGIRKLTKAFSFRGVVTLEEEPGMYSKLPRISLVTRKNDALKSVVPSQLIQYLKVRGKSDTKSLVWVDIQGTHDEMGEIAKAFELHPLTLEDCLVPDTREKIEMRNNYIYLVIHDVSIPGDRGANLNMIIFQDMLLTIHETPIHSIYDVIPKLEFCDGTEIPSIEFIVYVILSSVISFYGAHVEQVKQKIDLLDEEILTSSRLDQAEMSDLLGKLSAALKRTSSLREDIGTKKDLLGSLSRNDILFSPRGLQYIKGAHDQVLKMNDHISLLHDILSDANELYMAKISVQLAVVANEVGIVSRKFAVISFIFLPPNLIAAVVGMNVQLPALANANHTNFAPFIAIIFTMVGTAILMLLLYRRMKF